MSYLGLYILIGLYKPRKKHAGKRGHPTSKRGSSQQNHLDQTQSREFGQMEEGESHLEDGHGA